MLDVRVDSGGAEKGIYCEQQLISRLMHCHLYPGSCRHHVKGGSGGFRGEPWGRGAGFSMEDKGVGGWGRGLEKAAPGGSE